VRELRTRTVTDTSGWATRTQSVTDARVMCLDPGEPAARPWEAVEVGDLVAHVRRATG